MAVTTTLFIVVVLVIAIWVIIELKRMRHKIFAMFLIALILFSYLSFSLVLKGEEIDMKTIPGMVTAGGLYFSWLGSIFTNMKQITTKAVKMDWGTNKSVEEVEKKSWFDFGKKSKTLKN